MVFGIENVQLILLNHLSPTVIVIRLVIYIRRCYQAIVTTVLHTKKIVTNKANNYTRFSSSI